MKNDKPQQTKELLVGRCPKMVELYKMLGVIATTGYETTILIEGESGVGKEVVAKVIHHWTASTEPFVTVDCAQLPENLLENELFGHEKGAFTGADKTKIGKFELAQKGVLFLDEIGELPRNLQQKLLRVLQTREFERVGGIKTLKTEARFITATNRDLEELVKKGEFREDLFYRLDVIRIKVPPLRERKEDIPLLVEHFLNKLSLTLNKKFALAPGVMELLLSYDYPGNVRELEHTIERSAVFSPNGIITPSSLPQHIVCFSPTTQISHIPEKRKAAHQKADKDYIVSILRKTKGNVTKAAEVLGIKRQSLHRLIKKYNIVTSQFRTMSLEK